MADFKQAIEWMKEGKKVKRPHWVYPILIKQDFIHILDLETNKTQHYQNCVDDFEATDWEIYCKEHEFKWDEFRAINICKNCGFKKLREKESLSDQIAKIDVFSLVEPSYAYDPNHVKKHLQNAQRRLKKDIEEAEKEYKETGAKYCIEVIIERRFKKEFGDKLI